MTIPLLNTVLFNFQRSFIKGPFKTISKFVIPTTSYSLSKGPFFNIFYLYKCPKALIANYPIISLNILNFSLPF